MTTDFCIESYKKSPTTYKIIRYYYDDTHPRHGQIIRTNLSLKSAIKHCRQDNASEIDQNNKIIWFDAYIEERKL